MKVLQKDVVILNYYKKNVLNIIKAADFKLFFLLDKK